MHRDKTRKFEYLEMCIETIRDIQVIKNFETRQERDEILARKIRENFETVYFFPLFWPKIKKGHLQ